MPFLDWKFSQTCYLNVNFTRKRENNIPPLQDAHTPAPDDDNPPPSSQQNPGNNENEHQQPPMSKSPSDSLMIYSQLNGNHPVQQSRHREEHKNPQNSNNGHGDSSTHANHAIQPNDPKVVPANSRTVPEPSSPLKPIEKSYAELFGAKSDPRESLKRPSSFRPGIEIPMNNNSNANFFNSPSFPTGPNICGRTTKNAPAQRFSETAPPAFQTAYRRPVDYSSEKLGNQPSESKKPRMTMFSALTNYVVKSATKNADFTISDPNVSTEPPLADINDRITQTGDYNVTDLTICHKEHGNVKFLGNSNLSSLAPSADLSYLVSFDHGRIEVDECMKNSPMMMTLYNVTRDDLAKAGGIETVDDKQLEKIVRALASHANASYSWYSSTSKTLTFLLFFGPSFTITTSPTDNNDEHDKNGNDD